MNLQIETSWAPRISLSPAVVLQALSLGPNRVCYVAREDLLEGGTKQRAIEPYLRELRQRGHEHFVYASPFCGFAQVALAACARGTGVTVTLFCEKDSTNFSPAPTAHAFSKLAESFGARIILCDSLSEAETLSAKFATGLRGRYKIPLGFADASYLHHMKMKLHEQYKILCQQLGTEPRRFWLPVGSGTLARIFAEILPLSCEMRCLNVRVLASSDARLESLRSLPNLKMMDAPELFHEVAATQPPCPSNIHYDAKLWRFIRDHGEDGDVWWNVAR